MNGRGEVVLLQRLLSVASDDIKSERIQQITEEVCAFSGHLSWHVVDAAYQNTRSFEALRIFVPVCIVQAEGGVDGSAFVHEFDRTT